MFTPKLALIPGIIKNKPIPCCPWQSFRHLNPAILLTSSSTPSPFDLYDFSPWTCPRASYLQETACSNSFPDIPNGRLPLLSTALGTCVALCKNWLSNPRSSVKTQNESACGYQYIPPRNLLWGELTTGAGNQSGSPFNTNPQKEWGSPPPRLPFSTSVEKERLLSWVTQQLQRTYPSLCLLDLADQIPKSASSTGEYKSNKWMSSTQNKTAAVQLTFPVFTTLCLCLGTQAGGGC